MPHLSVASPQEIGLDSERLKRAIELLEGWTKSGEVPSGSICVGRRGRLVQPHGACLDEPLLESRT